MRHPSPGRRTIADTNKRHITVVKRGSATDIAFDPLPMSLVGLHRTLSRLRTAPLATLAPAWLLALVCMSGAGLAAARYLAPTPPAPAHSSHDLDTDPIAAAERIAAAQLFAHQSPSASASAPERSAAEPAITLVGIATGFAGGSAFAMLGTDSTNRAVRLGEPVGAGHRLHRILADRVELERNGHLTTLKLAERPTADAGAPRMDNARAPDAAAHND